MGNVIISFIAHSLWGAMHRLFCSPRLGLATIAKNSQMLPRRAEGRGAIYQKSARSFAVEVVGPL